MAKLVLLLYDKHIFGCLRILTPYNHVSTYLIKINI